MKKYTLFLVLLLTLTACSKAVAPVAPTPETANQAGPAMQDMTGAHDMPGMEAMTGTMDVQEPLANTGTGGNDYTFFFKDTMSEKVTLKHTAGHATNIYFINADAKKMKVVATPKGENGNIRLSQIVAPDGTADGPFGRETEYDLTQNGGYALTFNENLMAGDPWSGEVEIEVTLSK